MQICCCVSKLMAVTAGYQVFNLGYSKFANQASSCKIPSRLGMLLLYAPPMLMFPLGYAVSGYGTPALPGTHTTWHLVLGALVTAHFFKRVMEVLFLHKFSGSTNVFSCILIIGLYMTLAVLLYVIASYRLASPADIQYATAHGWSPKVPIGVLIFAAGQLANLYHHWLLATLRKPGDRSYKVPRGGAFSLVCCPHYTAELVSWMGVALVTSHFAAYVMVFTMACYLSGRARSTLIWYEEKARLEKLDRPLPSGWKRILPFVY